MVREDRVELSLRGDIDPRVIILASHLSGEGYFHSGRFSVTPVPCGHDYDYWCGVNAVWDSGCTIVNVEHDIEVTDDHIQTLLDCPHSLCSWAYACHWITTHFPCDVYAAGAGARDIEIQPRAGYLTGGEEWANWSAIGLVKITQEARIRALRREPWNRLELAIGDAIEGAWHMHWPPIAHHHW